MRRWMTITACKWMRRVGKVMGKGSSLPGKIALKMCPDILDRVTLRPYIIAVTGSNGKTSTVEMIADLLTAGGKKVVWNKEGSNQIEGVTTLVLSSANGRGKIDADILLIESDERFARHTFRFIKPTHYVITNLYRDQLTRNGHPLWVYDALKDSIYPETKLILNADDPLVSCFGEGHDKVVWFGAGELDSDRCTMEGIYHDGKYCPVCQSPMEYTRYHYDHIGHYACTSCEFKRRDTAYTVTKADLDEGKIVINDTSEICLSLKSLYNIYNMLAAYTVASIVGIEEKVITGQLNQFVAKNGRVVKFIIGKREGILLTSKHENSISYNQSLSMAAAEKNGCDVMILVDAVSRKYFTSDTSWLWDIHMEKLDHPNIHEIILAGTYCHDLAVRFSYTGIAEEKIKVIEGIDQAAEYLDSDRKEQIYVITCFSDKDKILEKVTVR